jgi:hypothetical protein
MTTDEKPIKPSSVLRRLMALVALEVAKEFSVESKSVPSRATAKFKRCRPNSLSQAAATPHRPDRQRQPT